MDNCLTDIHVQNDNIIIEIFLNARHYGITSIFTMDSPMYIKPELRENLDYIFIL